MIALPMITKTIAILGGAYGGQYAVFSTRERATISDGDGPGARAAQILAAGIPNDWRIILVDRNSYVFFLISCKLF